MLARMRVSHCILLTLKTSKDQRALRAQVMATDLILKLENVSIIRNTHKENIELNLLKVKCGYS